MGARGAIQPDASSGAEEAFMKTHHPWWPHLDRDPIFNPFVSITERRPTEDWIEFYDEEEEESDERAPEQVSDRWSADK